MGNLYKNPDQPLSPEAFRLVRLARVGGYALQPVWAAGWANTNQEVAAFSLYEQKSAYYYTKVARTRHK